MAWENEKNGWSKKPTVKWEKADPKKIWPEMAKLCEKDGYNEKLAKKRKMK